MSTTDSYEIAREIAKEFEGRDLNEADTRHQIIDRLLHEVLDWPRNRVACEEYIAPGFADYILKSNAGVSVLLIEAKREGLHFSLPEPFTSNGVDRWVKLQVLMTDENIAKAVLQVREYCMENGIEVSSVTNGHEWIFFRPFIPGESWKKQRAYVICSVSYFHKEYTRATQLLSFSAITEKQALRTHLLNQSSTSRNLYFPKEKIAVYDQPVKANRLSSILRPCAEKYFGTMRSEDHEFMEKCYITQKDFGRNKQAVKALIRDTLSPYLKNHGIEAAGESDDTGKVARRITKTLQQNVRGRVVILFGGKGSGKSTFIRRLLEHNPPQYIRKHAVVVVVDMLETPGTEGEIAKHIWKTLVNKLDTDRVLHKEREVLLDLFSDKYELASKQELTGLDVEGEKYNLMLNQKLATWKDDYQYVAERLAEYWKKKHKGIVVVIDNTDQYSYDVQDYCFTVAQQVSKTISSLTVISMREERFRDSKIHGLLDAFQNSGYHIQSPAPQEVFKRRMLFTQENLRKSLEDGDILESRKSKIEATSKFFEVLIREFSRPQSFVSNFFNASAHGNIRLALDLFSGFLTSGYTNTDEMTAVRHFTINLHQVLKPVMVPDRFFYDEGKSEFPNLFKVRSTTKGSHFTSIRLLTWLHQIKGAGSGYVSMHTLKDVFVNQYGMLEDLEENLDTLLRYGMIESDNRLDQYSDRVDSLTITPYGTYALKQLCGNFAYLDLITLDCGVHDRTVANELSVFGTEDFRAFNAGKKYDRIILRIKKVELFLRYLKAEMSEEVRQFGVDPKFGDVLLPIEASFNIDRDRVMRSAWKNKSSADEG